MKEYTFGDVKKTLKDNTYYLEEKAKEAAGLTEEMELAVMGLKTQYQNLITKMKSAKPEEMEALEAKAYEIDDKTLELSKKMAWYSDFAKVKAVFDVLFVEGSDGITQENIGKRQVKEIWADFFA